MSTLNRSLYDSKHKLTIFQKGRDEQVVKWVIVVGFVLPSKRVTDLRAEPGGKCPMLCLLTPSSRSQVAEAVFFSLS